jgi:hypothetical protein
LRVSPATERRLTTWLPPLVVALLTLSFVLHQNAWWEWANPYWLLQRQTAHVSAHGVPTLFLHLPLGNFVPYYVYYSGFTLSLLAYPAAIFGPWPVFVAATVAMAVAGYLGVWWTARNLGLSARLAFLPALGFSSAPYVVSLVYGRGAWAEYVGANAAAVALGAMTALLWRTGSRGWSLVALGGASTVIAGTHNLSLLMCAIVLPLVVLALLPLAPRSAGPLMPVLLRAAGAVVLGVGLTAGWLLPNAWFGSDTLVATFALDQGGFSGDQAAFAGLQNKWFTISPDATVMSVYLRASLGVMACSLVALLVALALRRGDARRLRATGAGLVLVGLGLTLLIGFPEWWTGFPRLLRAVQFPFRLTSYLELIVALGAIIALTSLGRPRLRGLVVGALVLAIGVQLAGAFWSSWTSEATGTYDEGVHQRDLRASVEPHSFTELTEYQFRVLENKDSVPDDRPVVTVDQPHPVTDDTAVISGRGKVGDVQIVPVAWSPFSRITGDAEIVGIGPLGYVLASLTHTDAQGRWSARVEARSPWQLVVGRIISLISLVIVVGLVFTARRRRRRGPRAPEPAATDPAGVIIQTPDAAPTAAG